jgi:hypothetical protein
MATLRERWTQIFTFLSRAVTILLGIGLLLALFSSAPQKKITPEGGTEGGLFDVMAKLLADDLEPHGIDVTIVNRPDSLKIIDDIVDPKSPVDAGFVASDAPLIYYDKVSLVGTVMIAPVYLITHVESDVRDISDFANRSISLYPMGSAAWAACDYILANFRQHCAGSRHRSWRARWFNDSPRIHAPAEWWHCANSSHRRCAPIVCAADTASATGRCATSA